MLLRPQALSVPLRQQRLRQTQISTGVHHGYHLYDNQRYRTRHLMVTKVRGRFPVIEGKLVIDQDQAKSYVEAVIDVRAGDSGDPKRDEHLRSADFFDTD